jgi:hypothetical protein
MLFTDLKFSPNTVTLRLAALRFFYIHVLKKNWSIAETPYPKKVFHLPEILSQEEVARLIDAAEFPFHRILLMRSGPYCVIRVCKEAETGSRPSLCRPLRIVITGSSTIGEPYKCRTHALYIHL